MLRHRLKRFDVDDLYYVVEWRAYNLDINTTLPNPFQYFDRVIHPWMKQNLVDDWIWQSADNDDTPESLKLDLQTKYGTLRGLGYYCFKSKDDAILFKLTWHV